MNPDSIFNNSKFIEDYFAGLKKLHSDIAYFKSECITVIKQSGNLVKIYSLAFNLAWSLRYTMKLMVEYDKILRSSLLYDYWTENKEEVEQFEELSEELKQFITNTLDTLILEKTGYDKIESELVENKDNEEIKLICEDNLYFLSLSDDLAINGPRILNLIKFYSNVTYRFLVEIRNIRLNRTDSEYEILYESEFKDFLSTEEWNDLRDSFISTTITIKYSGIEPTEEQLFEMRNDEFSKMMDLRKELGSFDAYLSDTRKLARHLVNKEIKHNANNPILELFGSLGRLKLIDSWIEDLKDEAPLMEAFQGSDRSEVIIFSERLSEKRLKKLMPKIEKLYNERNAVDWVCLYHVLLYRNYISCDDFKIFALWLNDAMSHKVFSEVNIRQIKMSYWVKSAKKMWTIAGLHEWKNSSKVDKLYQEYERLCNDINDIIK